MSSLIGQDFADSQASPLDNWMVMEWILIKLTYRQVSNIRRTKSQPLKDACTVLRLSLPNPLKPDVKSGNEDVAGAAPTGDAPTTSEWSTILLPTKVRLILEVLQYVNGTKTYVFCPC